MDPDSFRHTYPEFIFDKFDYDISGNNLAINFHYSTPPDHYFIHHLKIENCKLKNENLDSLVFHLGLSLMPSYWKLTCSPVIKILAGTLPAFPATLKPQDDTGWPATPKLQSSEGWWHKLFIRGMGEYFYKNQIDFTSKNFLVIQNGNADSHHGTAQSAFLAQNGEQTEASQTLRAAKPRPSAAKEPGVEHVAVDMPNPRNRNQQVLVPVGGGKDSIVTLELLKPHFSVVPFVINPNQIMFDVIKTAGLSDPVMVTSTLDPHLLELNSRGYLNGHVPVSAFYAFAAVLTAAASGINYIAFSNERSSDEGNTTYLGHEINHQYSKSLEFESDLNLYLLNLNLHLNCFSFLRPLSELQITRIFSRYPQYFPIFSSCNRNFTLPPLGLRGGQGGDIVWCTRCPKCVSTALMLACFIGKEKVTEIMSSYPPDLPENQSLMDELLGKTPVKPFECVLSRSEAQAADEFLRTGRSAKLDQILTASTPNPNMPAAFSALLDTATQ